MMFVLVACEESQRVCIEFRKKGHIAFSCDIIDCSGEHPEWHIKEDVLKILNGNTYFYTMDGEKHYVNKWDMIIAFPPCTHLCVSGAKYFEEKRKDGRQKEGIEFFVNFLNADCKKVCIENPVGIISGDYITKHFPDLAEKYNLPRKPTQIIQPWMFGDNFSKTTCLWIKGLEPLKPDVTEEPEMEFFNYPNSNKRQAMLFYKTLSLPKEQRQKERSKTFLGIAKAMAEQWG